MSKKQNKKKNIYQIYVKKLIRQFLKNCYIIITIIILIQNMRY